MSESNPAPNASNYAATAILDFDHPLIRAVVCEAASVAGAARPVTGRASKYQHFDGGGILYR